MAGESVEVAVAVTPACRFLLVGALCRRVGITPVPIVLALRFFHFGALCLGVGKTPTISGGMPSKLSWNNKKREL